MVTSVYLLRHASTSPSPDFAPDFDWPLNTRGHGQARQLVPILTALGIDAVFSSPQRRAVETVAPFCKTGGLGIQFRDELRESGCNPTWVDDIGGVIRKHWDDFDYCVLEGEPHRTCQKRFVGALLQLAQDHRGKTLVCCSGGQAIGLALRSTDPDFGFDKCARMERPDLFKLTCDGDQLVRDWTFTFGGLEDMSSD